MDNRKFDDELKLLKPIGLEEDEQNENRCSIEQKYNLNGESQRFFSKEEGIHLATRYLKAKDFKARELLIYSHLKLIRSIAKKYKNTPGFELDDLVQIGICGFIKGLEKFDPSRGYKVDSYISWWIWQAIIRKIAEKSRIIRISNGKFHIVSKVKRTIAKLIVKNGYFPTCRQIVKDTGLPKKVIENALKIIREKDAIFFSDFAKKYGHLKNNEDDFMEFSIKSDRISPELKFELEEELNEYINIIDEIGKFLKKASNEMNKKVFFARFGLDDGSYEIKKKTMVGKMVGIRLRESIRQRLLRIFRDLARRGVDEPTMRLLCTRIKEIQEILMAY